MDNPMTNLSTMSIRHDWQRAELRALFDLPFNELLFQAQTVHRQHFDPNAVQVSTLLSIKTGACPEDCKYCSQSGHYDTGLDKEKLLEIQKVIAEAKQAKENGASIRTHSTVVKTEIKDGLWQLTIQNKAGRQSLVVSKSLIRCSNLVMGRL